MKPDVSIIVPTRNRLRLLPMTIASLLGQGDVAVEVVVVDDGSTDGAEQWLKDRAAVEPRLKVERHPVSRGVSAARNRGISLASGRWVAFCDDDDLWSPDKLSAQLAAMLASGAHWSCTGEVLVDNALQIIGHQHARSGDILSDLLTSNVVPGGGSATVVETELLRQLNGFDESLSFCEDWELWIRIAQRSAIASVDEPLVAHRQTAGSASTNVKRMREGRNVVLARYDDLVHARQVPRDDASYEHFLAKQLLRTGDRLKAAGMYADLLARHRQWQDVPRAVMALVAPRLSEASGNKRAAGRVPQAWRFKAEAWIRELLDTEYQPGHLSGVGHK
jgi:glycosyltransferase involved in cell wall biosynthesis